MAHLHSLANGVKKMPVAILAVLLLLRKYKVAVNQNVYR